MNTLPLVAHRRYCCIPVTQRLPCTIRMPVDSRHVQSLRRLAQNRDGGFHEPLHLDCSDWGRTKASRRHRPRAQQVSGQSTRRTSFNFSDTVQIAWTRRCRRGQARGQNFACIATSKVNVGDTARDTCFTHISTLSKACSQDVAHSSVRPFL